MLKQSPDASPMISKAIIVCPASLVMNWDREIVKWLGGRVNSLPIVSNKRKEIIKNLNSFIAQVGTRSAIPVIIISYETFRLYTDIFFKSEIGLVICDEGHRLKNSENQTYQALLGLRLRQKKMCFIYRLLSTGTLEEKIMQRQAHKKALSSCVVDDAKDVERHFTAGELKTLFQFNATTTSDTHDRLKCKRCVNGMEASEPPATADVNSDMSHWHHVSKDARRVPDQVLRSIHSTGPISFIMHQRTQEAGSTDKNAEEDEEQAEEEQDGQDEEDSDEGEDYEGSDDEESDD